MSGENWRVRVGPKAGRGPHLFASASALAPDIEGYVVDGALVMYLKSRNLANMILADQTSDDVLWTDVAAWEEITEDWQIIEQSGDRSAALQEWALINEHGDEWASQRKAMTRFLFLQGRLGPVSVALLALAIGAMVFIGAYLGLAAPGSSIAGDSHKLSDSLAAALAVALAAAVMGERFRRRQ